MLPSSGTRHASADPSLRQHGRMGVALTYLAVMAVSMAYGVTLPVMPFILERIARQDAIAVAWHTGALTGAYTVALFIFSAFWGALSDRIGRRTVIAIGLLGSAAALLWLDFAASLPMLYAARTLSGLLSSAVLPAALAYVGECSQPSERPARFARIAAATTIGFMLGPALGSWLSAMALAPVAAMRLFGILMIDSPFTAVAMVNMAMAGTALLLPAPAIGAESGPAPSAAAQAPARVRIRIGLVLTCIAVFGITIGEVGITLFGKQVLSLSPQGITRFFLICGIVMIVVQVAVFPACTDKISLSFILSGSMALAGLGLAMIPFLPAVPYVMLAFALVSAGTAMLIPSLATMISNAAEQTQGKTMGKQASAANLGQAIAAASTGALFLLAPAVPFLVGAAAAACGFALAHQLRKLQ